jgi:Na+(H+)/acetate symporter ActP
VAAFYLVAQMIAAGALIEALAGLSFPVAVIITGLAMLAYVIFGGMLATTWVQIIKAVLLLSCVVVLGVWVLGRFDFNPSHLLASAAERSGEGDAYLGPGLFFVKPLDSVSTGLAFALGTAGLPHILMRFYTVPDARAARGSAGWAVLFIGLFFGLVTSVTLIILSPAVWPGNDSEGSPFPLSNPAIVSIPVGFLGCVLGTLLSRESTAERSFHELRVRSETGMGTDTAVTRPA